MIQQTEGFIAKMGRLGSIPSLVVMSFKNILQVLQDQQVEIRQLREQLDLQARQIQELSASPARQEWPSRPRVTPNHFGPSLSSPCSDDWKVGAKVPHC